MPCKFKLVSIEGIWIPTDFTPQSVHLPLCTVHATRPCDQIKINQSGNQKPNWTARVFICLRHKCIQHQTVWKLLNNSVSRLWRECIVPENIHTPPLQPHRRFFVLHPSPRKFQFRFILHTFLLKVWLLRPPPPRNFQWPSMGRLWILSGTTIKPLQMLSNRNVKSCAIHIQKIFLLKYKVQHRVNCSKCCHATSSCSFTVSLWQVYHSMYN